jgi:hypothetical protein
LGGFGLGLTALSAWSALHDQLFSGIAGSAIGLLFIVAGGAASRIALSADATTVVAWSLRGRKAISRSEVVRLRLAGGPTHPTLYFLRSDDSVGLAIGTALFRISDLRAFAGFLKLDLSVPGWMG